MDIHKERLKLRQEKNKLKRSSKEYQLADIKLKNFIKTYFGGSI